MAETMSAATDLTGRCSLRAVARRCEKAPVRSMIHGNHLVIPFGISEQNNGFGIAEVAEMLNRMTMP